MFAIFPAPYVAVASLTTLSFRSSATSTSDTITGPADIAAGDLLILLDKAVSGAGAPSFVVPSGFTTISDLSINAELSQIVSYKIATGAEASASLTGMNGTDNDSKILLVFQGNIAISSVSVNDVNEEATDGNPTAQVVNASGGVVPLIVIGCYGTFTGQAIDPRGFTGATATELQQDSDNDLFIKYAIMNSSSADVTIDMDDEGFSNCLQSFFIEAA